MAREEVLVVALGGVEILERNNLGHNRSRENFGFVELIDSGPRGLPLVLVGIKDRRTILASPVRTLAVQLGGIVRHGEEDREQVAVGNLGWVVGNLHRLGMPRHAGAHNLVLRGRGASPGIARNDSGDAPHVLEHGVHTPEAASRQDCGLLTLGR